MSDAIIGMSDPTSAMTPLVPVLVLVLVLAFCPCAPKMLITYFELRRFRGVGGVCVCICSHSKGFQEMTKGRLSTDMQRRTDCSLCLFCIVPFVCSAS